MHLHVGRENASVPTTNEMLSRIVGCKTEIDCDKV